jgi:hypothetical protein
LGVRDPHRVELQYFSRNRNASNALLSERYGPALDPVWRGPSIVAEDPQPFGSWITDGHRLTVFYFLNINGHRPGSCTLDEHQDRVTVSLTVLQPQGFQTAVGGGFLAEQTVLLSRPIGSRIVIDAATGEPRAQWAGANDAPTRAPWTHLAGDGTH